MIKSVLQSKYILSVNARTARYIRYLLVSTLHRETSWCPQCCSLLLQPSPSCWPLQLPRVPMAPWWRALPASCCHRRPWTGTRLRRSHLANSDMMNDANILFKFCWSKDGYLAELKTEEEDNSISPYLPRGLRYWIGLTYIATEG